MDQWEVERIEQLRNKVWLRLCDGNEINHVLVMLRARYGVDSFEEMTNIQLSSLTSLMNMTEEKQKNTENDAKAS